MSGGAQAESTDRFGYFHGLVGTNHSLVFDTRLLRALSAYHQHCAQVGYIAGCQPQSLNL